MQLDLFEETTAITELKEELRKVKNMCRGLFARHDDLAKKYVALMESTKIPEKIRSKVKLKSKQISIFDILEEEAYEQDGIKESRRELDEDSRVRSTKRRKV